MLRRASSCLVLFVIACAGDPPTSTGGSTVTGTTGAPGTTSGGTAWPDGPEDLYVERDRELIWTTAEHPGKRVTLGIPMQGY